MKLLFEVDYKNDYKLERIIKMSYWNIPRKCSVCQGCGACDYEHELELGEISGDYNPTMASLMKKTTKEQDFEKFISMFKSKNDEEKEF